MRLRKNNLHVHVEETYLASDRVDYLGYTLSTKGIEPQLKKIIPILRFDKPKNVRQLRAFLGLINYYKELYHHRNHILEPLTRISSSTNKFKQWGPEQDHSFTTMKKLAARQILLHFPDYTKPFHVYTDASKYQLGGVIVQDDFPVAFYSRKLNSAQRNYTTIETTKQPLKIFLKKLYYPHDISNRTLKNCFYQAFSNSNLNAIIANTTQPNLRSIISPTDMNKKKQTTNE